MQTSSALEQHIRRWLDAWTGDRLEHLLSFYAEDVFYSDPARPQGITGKANLAVYLKKLLARYPSWVWTLETLVGSGPQIAIVWKARLPKEQGDVTWKGMDLVTFVDGKITRNEVYFDPSPLTR